MGGVEDAGPGFALARVEIVGEGYWILVRHVRQDYTLNPAWAIYQRLINSDEKAKTATSINAIS